MKCCGHLVCREGDFSNRRKCHPREVIMGQLSTFLYTHLFVLLRLLSSSFLVICRSLSLCRPPLFIYILLRCDIKKEGHTQHIFVTAIWLGHMVKDDSDSKRRYPLLPHGLHFLISSKGYFICTIL